MKSRGSFWLTQHKAATFEQPSQMGIHFTNELSDDIKQLPNNSLNVPEQFRIFTVSTSIQRLSIRTLGYLTLPLHLGNYARFSENSK